MDTSISLIIQRALIGKLIKAYMSDNGMGSLYCLMPISGMSTPCALRVIGAEYRPKAKRFVLSVRNEHRDYNDNDMRDIGVQYDDLIEIVDQHEQA